MNQKDFIKKLFIMYPNTFTENNMQHWNDAYCIVFGNKKINFEKLFTVFVENYTNTLTPPAPAWFKEHLSDCIVRPDKCAALIHLDNMKKEGGTPPPKDLKQKLEALIAKTSM